MIGATIAGRYRLAALIAQSRAGELYKAADLTGADRVTIQLLPPAKGTGSGTEQTLAAAVAAMAPLNEPGILRPFAQGLDEGRPYRRPRGRGGGASCIFAAAIVVPPDLVPQHRPPRDRLPRGDHDR